MQIQGFCQKISKRVTVEPVLFLYLFAGGLWWPAQDGLRYRKVCDQVLANETVCSLSKMGRLEDEVQTEAATWQLYATLINDIPPLILAFIYGAVADHHSHRVVLLLPITGMVATMIWFIINSAHMYLHVGWLLVACLHSITGGWLSLYVGCFSYLSLVSPENQRTAYFAVAEGVSSASTAVSLFLSGVILDHSNYVVTFSIPLVLYSLAFLYAFFLIKEPASPSKAKKFRCKQATASFTCVFKKRPNNGRQQILVLLACLATYVLATGPDHLSYLHLKHEPLSWSQSMYGYFRGVSNGIRALTIFLLVPLLRKKLPLQDPQLMMLAFATYAISRTVFGLSTKTWLVFMVPFIDCLHDIILTCKRSILSKLVHEDELGQALAALASLHSTMNLIASVALNKLYPHTLHVTSGLVFYMGAALCLLPLALMWWLHRDFQAHNRYCHLEEESNNGSNIQSSIHEISEIVPETKTL